MKRSSLFSAAAALTLIFFGTISHAASAALFSPTSVTAGKAFNATVSCYNAGSVTAIQIYDGVSTPLAAVKTTSSSHTFSLTLSSTKTLVGKCWYNGGYSSVLSNYVKVNVTAAPAPATVASNYNCADYSWIETSADGKSIYYLYFPTGSYGYPTLVASGSGYVQYHGNIIANGTGYVTVTGPTGMTTGASSIGITISGYNGFSNFSYNTTCKRQ